MNLCNEVPCLHSSDSVVKIVTSRRLHLTEHASWMKDIGDMYKFLQEMF
jgi:hypothetical protein